MEELENPPIDLLPSSPTQPIQDFCVDLGCNSDVYHVVLSSHPPSFGTFGRQHFGVLCSSVLDLTCDFHKDQVLDQVGVEQEYAVKDDLLLSAPRPLYLDIFQDFFSFVRSCENSFLNVFISRIL